MSAYDAEHWSGSMIEEPSSERSITAKLAEVAKRLAGGIPVYERCTNNISRTAHLRTML